MTRGWRHAVRDIWDDVRTQPARLGLAFLAIAIGIAALTVLLAVLGGLRERTREVIQALGTNVVAILAEKRVAGVPGLDLQIEHAALLKANLADCAVSTLRVYKTSAPGINEILTVAATDESFAEVRQWTLQSGRFLDRGDLAYAERNAVISLSLSRLFGWSVGSIILLGDLPFRVVGVINPGGAALEHDGIDERVVLGERVVFVPRTVVPYWSQEPANDERHIDAVFVRYPPALGQATVSALIERLLSQPEARLTGFVATTAESMVRRLSDLRRAVALAAGSIVCLCLVLGGTTLMSIMIANVRERIPEIGLRRAMGATRADIALLFVAEGCLVTLGAALLGCAAAHAVSAFLGASSAVPLAFNAQAFWWPMSVALILGAAFSYWPARLGANIAAAEALRNE